MEEVTMEDRRRELNSLLERIRAHPEKDWDQERGRIAVLQRMLAAEELTRQY